MNKEDVQYDDYEHIETGLKVKAVKFKYGMEDGRGKNNQPYIVANDLGFVKKIPVDEKKYIVLHKDFKFVFTQDAFRGIYKRRK